MESFNQLTNSHMIDTYLDINKLTLINSNTLTFSMKEYVLFRSIEINIRFQIVHASYTRINIVINLNQIWFVITLF